MKQLIFILSLIFSLSAYSQDTTVTYIKRVQKGIVYQYKIDSIRRVVIETDGGLQIESRDSVFKTDQYQVIGQIPVDGGNDDTITGQLVITDFENPIFEPYAGGIEIKSAVWPYKIFMNSLNGLSIEANDGYGSPALVNLYNDRIRITDRDGYTPSDPRDVLTRAETEAIVDPLPTQGESDARYIKKNVADTTSATLQFADSGQAKFGTGSTNVLVNRHGIEMGQSAGYGAHYKNAYWMVYDPTSGITEGGPDYIQITRNATVPGATDVLTQDEIKDIITDSLNTVVRSIDTTGTVGLATKYDLTTVSGGGGSPGGSDNQVQYKSGSTFAGASNVEIASGNLKIDSTSTPSAPTSGTVFYTGENIGIEDPYFIGADGFNPSAIQGAFRDKNITMLTGSGIGGVINVYGCALPTGTYSTTLTGATTAGTNSYTKQQKTELLKTAAAGTNVSYLYLNAANWRRGSNAGEDGFKFQFTFGVATGTSNTSARLFAGWTSSISVPTDANPSAITNMFGFGYDSADTNLQWMHNDGSGTATKIDLGSSFPKPSVDRQESYEIEINCRPNGSAIWYKIRRIHTGATASGSVTTDIPANTTYLAPRVYLSNAGVSAVNGLGFMKMYIETSEF